ncbi:MAG: hypothetical protein ACHQ1F_11855 [Spirochaetia bacterium]|nr:hypothetical protein [Spirochaetia bacterium]
MRKAAYAGLLAAVALLVLGCSGKFESFRFQTAEGVLIDIRESPPRALNQESHFQPTSARPATPVYSLATPVVTPAENQSFQLAYTSSIKKGTLRIFSSRDTLLKSVPLPPSSGTLLRYLVPLAKGDRIWGYQVDGSSAARGEALDLAGAGTAPFIHGFEIRGDGLTVDGSVAVLAASPGAVSARISEAAREEMNQGTWVISLGLDPNSAGGRISFSSAERKTAVFDISPTAGLSRLIFARGAVEFLPRDIAFEGSLQSLSISQLRADAPIPADPGAILTWDQASWRRPDFEVFSWDRFPSVLIIDTASYAVQDDLFKRLAFFVEKAGHAGTIESPAALSGIRGYNAHDYKADDLARFFATAAKQGISLTPGEEELARLLLQNGVLRKTNESYGAGDGSVISIARSSSAILRNLLLTHECFHGAFFTLPGFRDAVQTEWASLSAVEKQVWLSFLASRGYNTEDSYLVVNEFQSYLLQQERKAVTGFQSLTLSRMHAGSARGAALAERMRAEHPDSFLKSFDALDQALQSEGGPPGGDAVTIRRE